MQGVQKKYMPGRGVEEMEEKWGGSLQQAMADPTPHILYSPLHFHTISQPA